jgi:hypothetical protein
VFNFGNPKTPFEWISHIALGVVALLLILWLMRLYAS